MLLKDYNVVGEPSDILEDLNTPTGYSWGWTAKEVFVNSLMATIKLESLNGDVGVLLFSFLSARLLIEAAKRFMGHEDPMALLSTLTRQKALRVMLAEYDIPEEVWMTKFPHPYTVEKELFKKYISGLDDLPNIGFGMKVSLSERGQHKLLSQAFPIEIMEQDRNLYQWAKDNFPKKLDGSKGKNSTSEVFTKYVPDPPVPRQKDCLFGLKASCDNVLCMGHARFRKS
jgi:hypothetical protein